MEVRFLDDLAKVLAVLVVEEGSYTYVDKLGNAPSVDLALHYIREALRDFHSLLRKGSLEHEELRGLLEDVGRNINRLQVTLSDVSKIEDRKELRKIVSLVSSKALALAAFYLIPTKGEEEG